MAIIKQRPAISLLAPAQVQTGQRFAARARLDCPAELEVDSVEVELVGLQVFYSQSQYGRHRSADHFCRARQRVRGRGKLAAGEHEFAVEFEIPERFAATYYGKHIRVEWELRVHVDIPWWPDARAGFTLGVVSGRSEPDRAPGNIWSSRPEGPPPKKPHVELSVGSTQIEPGGTLEGAVALANVEFNEYRGLEAALVGVERSSAGLMTNNVHVEVARWRLPLESPKESEPVRFSLSLPRRLVPGFDMQRIGLAWFLRVDVDVAWALDPRVWVPVSVRVAPAKPLALTAAPLAVGNDRVEQIWKAAAESTGFNYLDGALRRESGHTRVEVRREHRGRRGVHVVASLEYPDLGMDLGWTRRGGLEGRDPEQVSVVRDAVGDRLDRWGPAEVDDQRMIFELETPGQQLDPLVEFTREVFSIARRVDGVRGEIPAPTSLADQVPRWRKAAAAVGGALRLSAMQISGSRDELRFELGVSFKPSGAPDHLEVEVRPAVRLDARHHLDWREGAVAPELDERAAELLSGASRVCIDADRIAVSLDVKDAQIEDGVEALERMLGLARQLTGQIGPYR